MEVSLPLSSNYIFHLNLYENIYHYPDIFQKWDSIISSNKMNELHLWTEEKINKILLLNLITFHINSLSYLTLDFVASEQVDLFFITDIFNLFKSRKNTAWITYRILLNPS